MKQSEVMFVFCRVLATVTSYKHHLGFLGSSSGSSRITGPAIWRRPHAY